MTIYDPRRPDVMLWLAAMEPAEAACVMTAMQNTFPVLRGNKQWAQHIDDLSTGLSDDERQQLAKRAARIGDRIMEEFEAQLGYRPYLR